MNLSINSEIVQWPQRHYLYVEKVGPFQDTAMPAWQELHHLLNSAMVGNATKIGAMALFKMQPDMIYRAGFFFDRKPELIPTGLKYFNFQGGKYSKSVLTGSYMNLGPAWGAVMEKNEMNKTEIRADFFIENYANDPMNTPEENLVSELMVPIN